MSCVGNEKPGTPSLEQDSPRAPSYELVPTVTMGLEDFDVMLVLLKDYVAVRYTNVAFLMFLLYDHIITFDIEVERIWTLPWRLPKILFLFSRYIVPPMLLFDGLTPSIHIGERLCDFIAKWTAWPTILSIAVVDGILILRVIAIYGHSKVVAWFLVVLFICMLCAWVGLSTAILVKTTSMTGGELFTGCLFSAPSYFYAAWIPATCFETVIVVLTIFKVIKYDTMTPTLRVLARDSMIYFTSVFAILLVNLFLARYGRGFLGALFIQPCSSVACVAAARMVMNIREFTMQKDPPANDYELATMNFRPGDAETTRPSREHGYSTIVASEA